MKQLLLNLQTRLRDSDILSYIDDDSILVDDTELRFQKISVDFFPGIVLQRAGENTAQSHSDLVIWRKTVEIVHAQQYNEVDTVIMGDGDTKGITDITDDILAAIYEEPGLNNYVRGFDPGTIRIEEGFLSDYNIYTAARRMFIDFLKVEQIKSQ